MIPKPGDCFGFIVEDSEAKRLDLWLSERINWSRSQLKKLIDQECVLVNGQSVKAGYRVQHADQIELQIPQEEEISLAPEPIPLEILYEDDELAVIVKPQGLVVHAGAGHLEGTLVNALVYHFEQLGLGEDHYRPGIVHRLDKDTSGLMMIAKTDQSYVYLVDQLKKQRVERRYLCLVHGVVKEEQGIVATPIARHSKERTRMTISPSGRPAKTHYLVKEQFPQYALLECSLVTGRTHQIRVHLASIHHPVVGDRLYGYSAQNLGAKAQVLHAHYLSFQHPSGKRLAFQNEPGSNFNLIVAKARA